MENVKQMGKRDILKPKKPVFELPVISIVHFTETDFITTSGEWEEIPEEGERV